MRNTIRIEIEWGDCDPAEIVYYPNYFRWFNFGAHKLFDAVGLPFARLIKDYNVLGVPLLDVQATFRAPSRFGDILMVTSQIGEWRNKSFVVNHEIYRDDTLCVEGREIRAWVAKDDTRPGGIRALPVPAEIKRRFAGID